MNIKFHHNNNQLVTHIHALITSKSVVIFFYHSSMEKIESMLKKELEILFDKFSKEKNFHPGDYCSALTRYCISLNYDCADNPLSATGFIMLCWAHEMKLMNDQNDFEELTRRKKLLC